MRWELHNHAEARKAEIDAADCGWYFGGDTCSGLDSENLFGVTFLVAGEIGLCGLENFGPRDFTGRELRLAKGLLLPATLPQLSTAPQSSRQR